MKKLMILAAVVIAAAACSKTYEVKSVSENAIGFGTWADNLTRAPHLSGTAFNENDIFYVYGFKEITSPASKTNVFDGVKVTKGASDWTYSPIRFWDHNTDSYTFYGVSPSEETVAVADLIKTHDVQAGTMTSKDLTFAGNNNDILVAEKKTVEESNYGKTVELNFRHAASLFDLKVRKGKGLVDAGATVKVTAVSIINIQSAGNFEVTGYAASAPYAPTISSPWNAAATPATAAYDNTKGCTQVEIAAEGLEITATKDTDPQYLINSLVVIPQTFSASNQALKISYKITTGTGDDAQTNEFNDKTYDLVLFDKTDYDPANPDSSDPTVDHNAGTKVTGWLPGYHYTYIVTLDAEAIVFSATMTDWATDGGYYYLVN